MSGWIKIKRTLKDWEWYEDSQMVHLWLHMLLSANHEERNWRGVIIGRGQFVSSRDKIAASTGISPQSVRTCIDRLKSTNELTIQSTSHYTLYTIVNYDLYQSEDETPTNNQPAKQPATNQPSTSHQPQTRTKTTIRTKRKDKEPLTPSGDASLFGEEDLPEVKEEKKKESDYKLAEVTPALIQTWLEEKQAKGIYVGYDPEHVLEVLRDYCAAKGATYKNYVAAYRSAFTWEKSKPAKPGRGAKPEKDLTPEEKRKAYYERTGRTNKD